MRWVASSVQSLHAVSLCVLTHCCCVVSMPWRLLLDGSDVSHCRSHSMSETGPGVAGHIGRQQCEDGIMNVTAAPPGRRQQRLMSCFARAPSVTVLLLQLPSSPDKPSRACTEHIARTPSRSRGDSPRCRDSDDDWKMLEMTRDTCRPRWTLPSRAV